MNDSMPAAEVQVKVPASPPVETTYFRPAAWSCGTFSDAKLAPGTPPQFSLPQAPVANPSVIAGILGTYVDITLPEPTTGMALPSTADCIWSVFQFMLMVTSLYGLKSTPLTEPVPVPVPDPELELALGLGLGLGLDPEPPVQAPSDVHGCPEPLPPLLVAGLLPWVHQLAV